MFTFVKNGAMKEKITYLMKSEGLSTTRLAEILEIQPSAVSHLVSGRNKPGYDLLQKILRRFPRINPDWLLLDSGEPYRIEIAQTELEQSDGNSEVDSAENGIDIGNMGSIAENNDFGGHGAAMAMKSIADQKRSGKSPIFVVVFYDDGSCENFSMR